MSHVERELLSHLIEAYGLSSASTLRPVTVGLIHQTYLIETPERPIAVAQGLHPALSDDAILSDYDRVTSHLAHIGYGGPELLKTLRPCVSRRGAGEACRFLFMRHWCRHYHPPKTCFTNYIVFTFIGTRT